MEDSEKIRFYTREHLWLELDDCGHWLFGVTQQGSSLMDGMTFVEVRAGKIAQGEEFAWLESRKAAWAFTCPFAKADCIAENKKVMLDPQILDANADETSIGVLDIPGFTADRRGDIDELLDEEEYKAFISRLKVEKM